MPTDLAPLIEKHQTEVKARMDELRPQYEEFTALEDYLGSMSNGRSARPRAATRSASASGPRRRQPRAGQANRPQQFLTALKGKPGATIPDISKLIGDVSGNYLYRVRDSLSTDDLIEKEGSGWKLTEKGEAALAEMENAS